jgi:tetratricopeptide (TPR) repeat protein
MSNRCFILLGTGLLAVSFLLASLHADRPPERDPAPASTTTTPPQPQIEPEPPPPDPLVPDQPAVSPSPDTAPPIGTPPGAASAEPARTTEDSVPSSNGKDAPTAPEPPPQPEEEPAPIPIPTPVPPVSDPPATLPLETEPGPPPLQRADLDPLTSRLAAIEENLAGQQQRAMELVVSSNRTALIVAGIFAGVGVLAILLAALVMARVLNRFSDVVMTLPAASPFGRTAAIPWSESPEIHPTTSTAVEQVSARFLGAIEQLEQRIRELERPTHSPPRHGRTGNGAQKPAPVTTDPAQPESAVTDSNPVVPNEIVVTETPQPARTTPNQANELHRQVEELLVEGENLLQQDRTEQALEQFEDALALEPHNADALIKRGMALERLQRMEAALESYDRAIASNGSLTLAYLHKGAVCNRLQRYREALECYERALQTEHKP